MQPNEQKLLRALVGMVEQYLGSNEIDTMCMSAGEHAVEVLAKYGLVEPLNARCARWTEAGKRLLNADWRNT